METRVEKRKRLRKHNRKKVYKFIIIAFAVIILYLGIKVVNQNIVYLGYLENQNIFKINILKGKLNLFGKGYYIDLKILKKKD